MRIAAIDIGTNTVLLLIAESNSDGIQIVQDVHAIARLGAGVDRSGSINEEAYERLRKILLQHAESIRSSRVDHITAVATSAMRDAANRDPIIARIAKDIGITIELLSGDDEAKWTFRGALLGMEFPNTTRIGVVDIGGGSTEISFGTSSNFEYGSSTNIGAVRITERCFGQAGVTPEAVLQAKGIVRAALSNLEIQPIDRLVAVAGTPTTLAAMELELPEFDASRVQSHVLSRETVHRLLELQLQIDTESLIDRYPSINRARADILPAGTIILAEVMALLGMDFVTVSTRGLRYGCAIRAIEQLGLPTPTTLIEG